MKYNEGPGPSSSSQVDSRVFMHTVVPLPECPHLVEIRELPAEGVNALVNSSCSTCHSNVEQWVCLTCYSVNCGRYIAGHAVHHQMRTGHSMALSLTDLSVWCYPCESYVHHEILIPAKNAVHQSKFGFSIPEQKPESDNPSN
uniref:UBP-type domain-containing protein n=1 Tax=Setaria digitata TaxID=48799 RepID=A0A915PK87_9BILA